MRTLPLLVVFSLGLFPQVSDAGQAVRTRPNIRSARAKPTPPTPVMLRLRVEEGDLVTADIRNAPLGRVLEDLAARTGVVFELSMQDQSTVSLSLRSLELEEAIDRILEGHDRIYYRGLDNEGHEHIQFVRIFSRVENVAQPSLQYIGTGARTKTGDDDIESPEQALKALAEGADLETREKAVEVLANWKSETAVQALTLAVRDSDPEVRAAAIEGLAMLGARSALPAIINAFKDDNPGVRHSAITAVALLGDSDNLRDLRPMIRDQDAGVSTAAEMAIRRLSAPQP